MYTAGYGNCPVPSEHIAILGRRAGREGAENRQIRSLAELGVVQGSEEPRMPPALDRKTIQDGPERQPSAAPPDPPKFVAPSFSEILSNSGNPASTAPNPYRFILAKTATTIWFGTRKQLRYPRPMPTNSAAPPDPPKFVAPSFSEILSNSGNPASTGPNPYRFILAKTATTIWFGTLYLTSTSQMNKSLKAI
jgi:hypothetical protein